MGTPATKSAGDKDTLSGAVTPTSCHPPPSTLVAPTLRRVPAELADGHRVAWGGWAELSPALSPMSPCPSASLIAPWLLCPCPPCPPVPIALSPCLVSPRPRALVSSCPRAPVPIFPRPPVSCPHVPISPCHPCPHDPISHVTLSPVHVPVCSPPSFCPHVPVSVPSSLSPFPVLVPM